MLLEQCFVYRSRASRERRTHGAVTGDKLIFKFYRKVVSIHCYYRLLNFLLYRGKSGLSNEEGKAETVFSELFLHGLK